MEANSSSSSLENARRSLRKRSLRSFAVWGVCGLLGGAGWIWVHHKDGDSRPVLRKVLEWNGAIWQDLFSPSRIAQAPSPATGKKPRFNGNIGLEEKIDLADWDMEVTSDEASSALTLKMNDIRLLPRVETTTEFRCIEGWSDVISYAGVRFSDFLKNFKLGTHSGAAWDPAHPPSDTYRYVGLETPDGEYYVSIDMESMLHPQTVLAYEMNGKPLDGPNGAPLRLIIPVKYGVKSLKRIGKIFFSDQRPRDYWTEQGYDWFAGL